MKIIGIPDKNKVTDPRNTKNEIWPISIQKHFADRAGLHYDIRLGDPKKKIGHSWVVRHLPDFGEKVLAKQTSDHSLNYFDFSGEIKKGYGKGKVELEHRGDAIVTKSSPDKISFVINKGRTPYRYSILRLKDKNFMAINHTPIPERRPEIPLEKLKYKKEKDLDKLIKDPNILVSPKIDGAANVIVLKKNRYPEIFSYRQSKGPTRLVDHTFRLGFDKLKTNVESHKPTVLWAETFKVKGNKPVHVSETSGLLNSSMDKIRDKHEFKNIIYNIDKYEGKDVKNLPYKNKLDILREIAHKHPFLQVPPVVSGEKAKNNLIEKIRSGKHPLTSEGVVFYDVNKSNPTKHKFDKENEVYITGILEGKGKFTKSMGGLTYSSIKGGKREGVVGGGFLEDQRREIYNNPNKYIGKKAIIKSLEKLKSGSYRQPIFVNWKENEWPSK